MLSYIQERVRFEHALLCTTKLTRQIIQATIVDEYAANLSLKDKYIFVCAPISLNQPFEKDYYLLCLASVNDTQVRHLPTLPDWIYSQNASHLEAAELLSQNISLYAWLNFKFPQIFVDKALIQTHRKLVSKYIKQALRLQTGFVSITRELERN